MCVRYGQVEIIQRSGVIRKPLLNQFTNLLGNFVWPEGVRTSDTAWPSTGKWLPVLIIKIPTTTLRLAVLHQNIMFLSHVTVEGFENE